MYVRLAAPFSGAFGQAADSFCVPVKDDAIKQRAKAMPRVAFLSGVSFAWGIFLLLGLLGETQAEPTIPVYKNPAAPVEARVNDLLPRLTLQEKLELLEGTGFATKPIERLGIPPLRMCDGPNGVRGGDEGTLGPATAFPCGVAMAATWNPEIVQQIGAAIGRELQNKGTGASVILGPCVNIHRTPFGGRNAESFSEDPYLAARMTVAYITGVQSTGAAACVKHYACNNQEWERTAISVQIDERALREIYLPAFQAAVQEADVLCVMNAYNKVNGVYCSANSYLLNEILKGDWGFSGCVMTDWGAAHDTLGVALGGTDLEMPRGAYLNPATLLPLIEAGQIRPSFIDDKVRRILRTIIRTGLLDRPLQPNNSVVNCSWHREIARRAAAQAIVLLKNEGQILPLQARRLTSVAVLGPNAARNPLSMGGSGYVHSESNTNVLDCLRARLGPHVAVRYVPAGELLPPLPAHMLTVSEGLSDTQGLKGEYFANPHLQGPPTLVRIDPNVDFNWGSESPGAGLPRDGFSIRWTGKFMPPVSGLYTLQVASDDGFRLFVDGQLVMAHWSDHALEARTKEVFFQKERTYELRLEYYENKGLAQIRLSMLAPNTDPLEIPEVREAVEAARTADAAVIVAGLQPSDEGEGRDRDSLALPALQAALIKAVAAVQPKTIVTLHNGGPVLMTDWINNVPAVLECWYLGEAGGQAITQVLFGDVNPSGRLPDTIAQRREDYPDYGNYPGADGVVHYKEGIYVGYRHFDKNNIKPLFPFGYGLCYTNFAYSGLRISPAILKAAGTISVSFFVQNTGRVAGAEIVQLYVHPLAPPVDRPVRELKAFARVSLQPGERKRVTMELGPPAFAYCDVPDKQWRVAAGRYELQIGASSRDIRLKGNVIVPQTITWPWRKNTPTASRHNIYNAALQGQDE